MLNYQSMVNITNWDTLSCAWGLDPVTLIIPWWRFEYEAGCVTLVDYHGMVSDWRSKQ